MEVHLKRAIVVLLINISSATYDFVVKPEFGEKPQDLNITSYVGQTSRLPCTVKHLSGKRVSWIRQRDLQVLSTGRVTFSTDLRISVLPGTTYKLRRVPRATGLQRLLPNRSSSFPDRNELQENSGEEEAQTMRKTLLFASSSSSLSSLSSEETWSQNYGKKAKTPLILPTGKISHTVLLEDKDVPESGGKSSFLFHSKRKKRKRGRRSLKQYQNMREGIADWLEEYENPFENIEFPEMPSAHAPKSRNIRSEKSQSKASSLSSLSLTATSTGKNKRRSNAPRTGVNPIAIYPQGPISIGSDSKRFKLLPNYIDGVWEPEDYTLQIKFTKPQDAGTYICQINTEPRITQAVVLRVVKMRAEILGRRELFVKAGNPVKLSCRVNHADLSPGFILWYKGERLVDYDSSGGRIRVLTEAGGVSHLILEDALPEDSSNYTCSPAGGAPASLILNVIVDERPAAMQQGNNCPSATPSLGAAGLWCTTFIPLKILASALDMQSIPVSFIFTGLSLVLLDLLSMYILKLLVYVLLVAILLWPMILLLVVTLRSVLLDLISPLSQKDSEHSCICTYSAIASPSRNVSTVSATKEVDKSPSFHSFRSWVQLSYKHRHPLGRQPTG